MYHPVEEPAFGADGLPVMDLYEEVHEYIELHNPGTSAVPLDGWKLTGGIDFSFPPLSVIRPGQYAVVAKDKLRLAAVGTYRLNPDELFGPYQGQLSNQGETIQLRNAEGKVMDSVSYSPRFPWPLSANALGADEEWTGLKPLDFQYRGRSLERLSFAAASNDPANWIASPLPGEPSPGRPNAIARSQPKPVVATLHASQAGNGRLLIRRDQPVRIDCAFSSAKSLSNVKLEYFLDNIELTNETRHLIPMWPVGQAGSAWFTTEMPGLADRSLVRYRIRANRGEGDEIVSPRPGDPIGWHSYFVMPVRNSTNAVYDLFISTKSLRTLTTNITGNPRRVINPDPPGRPRPSWNATEPAVFVHEGVVYDVQMRHHGSRYRRDVGRRSLKVQFPRYAPFGRRSAFYLTDKDYQTEAGHALFRAAGIPTSVTRWADLYQNSSARLIRLEQEENDDRMLERVHEEQERLNPGALGLEVGEIYKCVGFDGTAEGPYGNGNGRQLAARTPWWTALQRYEWTFALQDHGWRGHTQLKEMVDQMWAARGPGSVVNTNALRTFFQKYWNLDKELTYLATINWMVPWDDVFHNYFLWQQRNGRWSQLPWDFDNTMNGQSANTSIFTAAPNAGPNYFKESAIRVFRDEFRQRAWFLNNTVLHPDNIAALGLHASIRTWSLNRFRSVNSQCALGVFERPNKPVNLSPAAGQIVAPFVTLQSSGYAYSTNPVSAHVSTTWMVRAAKGDYYDPVFRLTTSNELASVNIPPALLKLGQAYFWKCVHTDVNGHPSLASSETSFTVGRAARLSSDAVLNEIHAGNSSEAVTGTDWIELYNPGSAPRSLNGFSLTDDLLAPAKYSFPTNASIPPRGFLTIACDNATNAPGLHTGFALDAGGETVALYATTASGIALQDVITFGVQLSSYSMGRSSVDSDIWTLNTPTPGEANKPQPLGVTGRVRLNEWLANPASGEDWLELFNPEPWPVALDGLYLTDALDDPTKSPIRPFSFIAPRGFLKITADGQPSRGANHANFRLSLHGGAIGLYAADQTAIHTVMYGPQEPGVSQGALMDGSAALTSFSDPTPGKSNSSDADSDGLPDAWELAQGLNPKIGSDAAVDADGDGFSNLQEYQTGTNPRDPASRLRLDSVEIEPGSSGSVRIRFTAAPGVTYKVQYTDSASRGAWVNLEDVPAQIAARSIELTDATSASTQSARFYRLRSQ